MDIKTELEWIHKELDNVTDPTLLKAIRNILQYRREIISGRISLEEYNKEIDASLAQVRDGKTYTHEEIGKHIKEWAKE